MTDASARSADPTALLHRERLLPSPGAWLVLVVLGAIFGVVLVPLSTTLALAVSVLGMLAAAAIGGATSPVVEVREGRLRAGRAQVDVDLLGEPEVLEGSRWADAMGTGFEPLAFHCTRGWVRSGVRVPLDDDDDPTPAWVVSSRRPQDLALALQVARRAS